MKPAPSRSPRMAAPRRAPRRARQHGATVVEFAIVAMLFFTLLIGVVEMARVLFHWNTASEATRWGARMAVVCDANAAIIKTRMASLMPQLTASNIALDYEPAGCDSDPDTARATCASVTVRVTGLTVRTLVPMIPMTLPVPPFATTLSRESMNSATGGAVCS